ncbi:MAG TPA: diguanylate cyclase [Desulfonatronum sp.]|nr:diguanylate cyclase [Desulfonatronum sp.]
MLNEIQKDFQNASILAIDDSHTILTALKHILEKAGYRFVTALTGTQGLDAARLNPPDLILLDVMLPDGNGLDFCRKIKNDPALFQIPVILLSGVMNSPKEQSRGLDAGADGYMSKPFEAREIVARVKSLLRIKQAESALRESEQRYRALFKAMLNGFALHEAVRDDQGNLLDFRYVEVNPAFETQTGLGLNTVVGRTIREVLPQTDPEWMERYCKVVESGSPIRFEGYIQTLDKHFEVLAYRPQTDILAVIFSDVTKRVKSAWGVQVAKLQWEMTFNSMSDLIMLLDRNFTIMQANAAQFKALGLKPGEVLGKTYFSLVHSSDHPTDGCPHLLALADGQEHSVEIFDERLGGHFLVKVTPMLDKHGEFIGSVHVARNINDLKQTEERLKRVSDEYERVFQSTQDAMFLLQVTNGDTFRFIRNNKTHQIATDLSLDDLRGKTPQDMLGDELGAFVTMNYRRCVQAKEPIAYDEVLNLPAGEKTYHTTLTPVLENGEVAYIVGSAQDITERKKAEEQLRFLATTDEITGLWNRGHFMSIVRQELERARRYNQSFSLLMLDIDHFKVINDTHGHAAGDEAPRHLAATIKKHLRQVDVAGRFGGEEFAVILPQTDLDAACLSAERLREHIANSTLSYAGTDISLTVSIGVTDYRQENSSEDELYKRADDALYEAKNKGRNMVVGSFE